MQSKAKPRVGNYFRNSAQHYTVLDFLGARSERQKEAAQHIEDAIGAYDVRVWNRCAPKAMHALK